MSVSVVFRPKTLSTKQYDELILRLEKAGAANPRGRSYHVYSLSGRNANLFGVWDSLKDFEKFGYTLNPILRELKIDLGPPEIKEIHNIIEGNPVHTFQQRYF